MKYYYTNFLEVIVLDQHDTVACKSTKQSLSQVEVTSDSDLGNGSAVRASVENLRNFVFALVYYSSEGSRMLIRNREGKPVTIENLTDFDPNIPVTFLYKINTSSTPPVFKEISGYSFNQLKSYTLIVRRKIRQEVPERYGVDWHDIMLDCLSKAVKKIEKEKIIISNIFSWFCKFCHNNASNKKRVLENRLRKHEEHGLQIIENTSSTNHEVDMFIKEELKKVIKNYQKLKLKERLILCYVSMGYKPREIVNLLKEKGIHESSNNISQICRRARKKLRTQIEDCLF